MSAFLPVYRSANYAAGMDYEALIEWILSMDDAACADLFRRSRYGPLMHPEYCPKCATSRFGRVKSRVRVDACKGCGAQLSVTAGTALHGMQLPLAYAIAAAVLITRDSSISTRALAGILALKWDTARRLGHRVRQALAADKPMLKPGKVRLESRNLIVRRDQGEYPRSIREGRNLQPRLRAVALVDVDTGAAVIRIAERDQAMPAKQLIEEHLEGVEALPKERSPAWTLRRVDAVLRCIHERVSRRWIPLYASALAWRRLGESPLGRAWRALEVLLRADRQTWLQIRPAILQDELCPYSRFVHPKPTPRRAQPRV